MKNLRCLKLLLLTVSLLFLCVESRSGSFLAPGSSEITVSVVKKDATAESSQDGRIQLQVSGGVPPYKIHVFTPDGTLQEKAGSSLLLENISTGDYLFVIHDKAGASITREVKIESIR